MSYEKPYAGIRIIDMSHVVAGPFCASILARMGADVIKIEPQKGDLSRSLGKIYAGGQTVFSYLANIGKRSICLDLKSDAGADVVRQMIETADVFMESFRPGVTERLGFSYAEVKKINPNIIYLSMSGFGQRGSFAERPGTDAVMQAFSGFMTGNKGFDGLPHKASVIMMDLSAALYNVQAIQAALFARRDEQEGRYIDNSLLETAAAFQNFNLTSQFIDGEAARSPAYPVASFKCANGYVMVGVLYDREFKPFMEVLGLSELAEDSRLETAASRFENRELIDQPIEAAILKFDTASLCEKLREKRMLHERVNSYSDFMQHEQTQQMGARYWYEHEDIGKLPIANIPGQARLGGDEKMLNAPKIGEHTEIILQEMGYSKQDITALASEGAITIPAASDALN